MKFLRHSHEEVYKNVIKLAKLKAPNAYNSFMHRIRVEVEKDLPFVFEGDSVAIHLPYFEVFFDKTIENGKVVWGNPKIENFYVKKNESDLEPTLLIEPLK